MPAIERAAVPVDPPWKYALDLMCDLPPLPPELIGGLLHQGAKSVLGGSSKSNKTWCLLDEAVSVACGVPWWDFPTVQGQVLYLNLEIAEAFFARRIKAVADAKRIELKRDDLYVWNLRGQSCDAGKFIAEILAKVKDRHFALIVLDPIYKLLGSRDENKAGDIAALLNEIERLAVQSGAAVSFGAHYSKGNQSGKESIDRIGGSGVFARDPDAILTLTKHEEEDAFTCDPVLRNHPPHSPFVLRWQWPLMVRDGSLDPSRLKQQKNGREPQFDTSDLLPMITGNLLRTGELEALVMEQTKMSKATFQRLLKCARVNGVIRKNLNHQWEIVS